jgi:hypothetical protein
MGDCYTLQNGGRVVTLVFGGGQFQAESLWSSGYRYGFSRERMMFRPGTVLVVVFNSRQASEQNFAANRTLEVSRLAMKATFLWPGSSYCTFAFLRIAQR